MYQKSKWNNQQFLRYRAWHIEIYVMFCHFIPRKPKNIKILKNEKNCWRYYHFTHVYQKSQSCSVSFLKCGVTQEEFFVILGHFLHFYLLMIRKNKILKKRKNAMAQQTEFFCHLGLFFPLSPPWWPRKSEFWKIEKSYGHTSFYTCIPRHFSKHISTTSKRL